MHILLQNPSRAHALGLLPIVAYFGVILPIFALDFSHQPLDFLNNICTGWDWALRRALGDGIHAYTAVNLKFRPSDAMVKSVTKLINDAFEMLNEPDMRRAYNDAYLSPDELIEDAVEAAAGGGGANEGGIMTRWFGW